MTTNASQILYHHAKFRWTENLTCRFIQLRKEHGKMFTGRKYSAQAGWEYILRQMREEFPTIMADVHYRVLKKKWSNLLQQYKELKNPVHGDKNKADDISWPFYAAIDEVLGNSAPLTRRRASSANNDPGDDDDDDLNPQEFLCVSVGPDDEPNDQLDLSNDYEDDRLPGLPRLQPLRRPEPAFDVDREPRATRRSATSSRKRSVEGSLLSRLPRATELTIRPIRGGQLAGGSELPALEPIGNANGAVRESSEETTERQSKRSRQGEEEERESRLERRIMEFLEYTKRRDEENRSILMRLLEAVEDIRNAVG